jgi:hypothetical protein
MLIDLLRNELATRRGVADAHADIARGTYRYHLRGRARGWEKNLIRIAQRDYAIQIQRTGGCVCDGPDCFYDSALNRVVQNHLAQKLGFDPIERAFERARAEWEKARTEEIAALANGVAQQSHPPEPAVGVVQNGRSSPPAR